MKDYRRMLASAGLEGRIPIEEIVARSAEGLSGFADHEEAYHAAYWDRLALLAEREDLRATLKRIADLPAAPGWEPWARDQAQRALDGRPPFEEGEPITVTAICPGCRRPFQRGHGADWAKCVACTFPGSSDN